MTILLSLLKVTFELTVPLGYLGFSIEFVIHKHALSSIVAGFKDPLAVLPIILPVPLVLLPPAGELAKAIPLAVPHLALVLGPVCVLDDCFAFDFAVIECGCDFGAVGQLKHALALLHIVLVLAFVFEVAVRETVQAFAVALLRLPVQFAFVVLILV